MTIWRGDTIRIGDQSALKADIAQHGCRWFRFIGGPSCDNCGRGIRSHQGDLTIDRSQKLFASDWIAKPFTWSTLPFSEPDTDVLDWMEHIS